MTGCFPRPGQRRPHRADRAPSSFAPFPAIGAGIGLDWSHACDRLNAACQARARAGVAGLPAPPESARAEYWARRYWGAMTPRDWRGYRYHYRAPRCLWRRA